MSASTGRPLPRTQTPLQVGLSVHTKSILQSCRTTAFRS